MGVKTWLDKKPNRRRNVGTALDAASYLLAPVGVPGQAISYAATGKSLGENITGDSMVPGQGRESKSQKLTDFLTEQATTQGAEADAIKAELEAQGRPEMSAEVNRREQIASLAKAYAKEGMPEAQKAFAVGNIERSTSSALSGASTRGSALNTIGDIYGNQQQAFGQLNAQDAAMAQQNQGQYLDTLTNLGAAEGVAEGYNKILPYEQKLAEAQALKASSLGMKYQSLYFPYQVDRADQQLALDLVGAGGQAAGAAI